MKKLLKSLMLAAAFASLPLMATQAHARDAISAPSEVSHTGVEHVALFALPPGGLLGGDYGV